VYFSASNFLRREPFRRSAAATQQEACFAGHSTSLQTVRNKSCQQNTDRASQCSASSPTASCRALGHAQTCEPSAAAPQAIQRCTFPPAYALHVCLLLICGISFKKGSPNCRNCPISESTISRQRDTAATSRRVAQATACLLSSPVKSSTPPRYLQAGRTCQQDMQTIRQTLAAPAYLGLIPNQRKRNRTSPH
jgi:hypothetical protein